MKADLSIQFPVTWRGRKSAAEQEIYDEQVRDFCAAIVKFRSRLDFDVSSRGWCYILEPYGLGKGDFDLAEKLINDCRKNGLLPVDICGKDAKRETVGLIETTNRTPKEHARWVMEAVVPHFVNSYQPFDPWDGLDVYVEMVVEKTDLKSLFAPVCEEYGVPLFNMGGWADLNCRRDLMERMQKREAKGKQCVVLVCVDHDPGGLRIADKLRKNLADMTLAVGWDPKELEIVRFGLTFDFIERHGLTWIEGLETGSGQDLADEKHHDHDKAYVQDYIRRFGKRKVEANALLRDIEAGRDLCRESIEKYVTKLDRDRYLRRVKSARRKVWTFMPAGWKA